MSNPPTSPISVSLNPELQRFDRTTAVWGPATMIAGLVLSVAGPLYLMFFTDVHVSWNDLWKAYLAVGASFGVIWIAEPLTYYPMLGAPSMYQAFMIGNISNKLLPAAIAAQDRIGAEPGTKRAQTASIVAICGAAIVHLTSLLIFVGFLGTWLITVIPTDVLETTRTYILPVVMGAVGMQVIVGARQRRTPVLAWITAAVVILLVMPWLVSAVPVFAMLATPVAVVAAILVAWFARPRH